jgi:allophanate hydrolase
MSMTEPLKLSLAELKAAVASGAVTPGQVVDAVIERMAAVADPAIWIVPPDAARLRARAAELEALPAAARATLPLFGVPFAVKDNIDVAGLPTTAGCPAFAYTPERSATVVERLVEAGAVLIGKTNLDQFATGLVGTRSPYGALGAVYNRDYVSGGSSSGSAVGVAAGLVAFALGTDTAGSGRVPAAFNHLVGFKPTKGRWSTRGVVPACRTQDCVSVFASTAAEAAVLDGVLTGLDPDDPFSRRAPASGAATPTTRFRLGLPRPDQLNWFSDAHAARLFERAVQRLVAAGAEPVEVDIAPLLAAAALLYQGPWVAERTLVAEHLLRTRPGAIEPTVRAILQGGFAISAMDAFRADYELRAHQRAAEAIWAKADVLVLPTTATTYRLREVIAEPFALNSNLGLYTNFVNLLDMSAVALPAGFRDNATAFGVSLIGPAWADRALLELARRYEEIAPMPQPPPIDTAGVKPGVQLAVVGAHLAAMPLHWQLTSRDARLVRRCKTAPAYRLYAMAGSTPPKPALVHVGEGGAAIEVEVYELGLEAFGSFVVDVPPPLAIGTVILEDGAEVKGFVAEPRALDGASDITALGGWRAYIASLAPSG